MAPSLSRFEALNIPDPDSLPSDLEYFTLNAQPSTKLHRDPGQRDTITAPMILTALRAPLMVAEVTITAECQLEWDQAGLAIFVGTPPSSPTEAEPEPAEVLIPSRLSRFNIDPPIPPPAPGRWAKANLELVCGSLHLSCTTALSPSGCDSSLRPLPNIPGSTSVRVKFERLGDSLYVWARLLQSSASTYGSEGVASYGPEMVGGGWVKVREVAGFFWGTERKAGCWVGCFVSRPMRWEGVSTGRVGGSGSGNGLWAEFEDLEVL